MDRLGMEERAKLYKKKGSNNEELRRRRRENEVELRKQKRQDILENRRKITEVNAKPQTSRIPSEIIDQLKSEQTGIEATAIRIIGSKLTTSEWSLFDLCSNGILSILSDIYSNRRRSDIVARSIAEIFRICSNRPSDAKTADKLCIESLCLVLGDNDESIEVTCDCLQAISVFVGMNIIYRNIAFDSAIVPELLNVYERNDPRANRCLMWLVSQLFHRLQEYSPRIEEVAPLMELVASGMQSTDTAIQSDAIRACAVMAEWPDIWQEMHTNKLLVLLVNSLSSGIGVARPSVLKAIDFITETTPDFTQEMIDAGLLNVLKPIINVRYISRDVCYILANISGEGEHVIDRLISSGVLLEVTKVMETAEYRTRKEAAYTICHCCSSTSRAHIAYILEIGLLRVFTDLLTCMDPSLVTYILDALESLLLYGEINLSPDYTNPVSVQLEEIGCRAKLEFLSQSQNIDIHIKSYTILDRFFDDDELVHYNATCSAELRSTVDQTIESLVSAVAANDS